MTSFLVLFRKIGGRIGRRKDWNRERKRGEIINSLYFLDGKNAFKVIVFCFRSKN